VLEIIYLMSGRGRGQLQRIWLWVSRVVDKGKPPDGGLPGEASLDPMGGIRRFDSGDYIWRLEVVSRPGTKPSLWSLELAVTKCVTNN
jgi:hypothetical protein